MSAVSLRIFIVVLRFHGDTTVPIKLAIHVRCDYDIVTQHCCTFCWPESMTHCTASSAHDTSTESHVVVIMVSCNAIGLLACLKRDSKVIDISDPVLFKLYRFLLIRRLLRLLLHSLLLLSPSSSSFYYYYSSFSSVPYLVIRSWERHWCFRYSFSPFTSFNRCLTNLYRVLPGPRNDIAKSIFLRLPLFLRPNTAPWSYIWSMYLTCVYVDMSKPPDLLTILLNFSVAWSILEFLIALHNLSHVLFIGSAQLSLCHTLECQILITSEVEGW